MGVPRCGVCGGSLALQRASMAPRPSRPPSVLPVDDPDARRVSIPPLPSIAELGTAPPAASPSAAPSRASGADPIRPGAGSVPAPPPATQAAPSIPDLPDLELAPPPARSAGAKPADGRSSAASAAGIVPAESPYARLSLEELMEQARHYVCKSCSTPVPHGHKFCGRCGEGVPPEILSARTLFFGDMQSPTAKLILIRGEGMEGLSFHLKAEQHVVGRTGQLVFPDDPFVSPKHANFFYRDSKLVVRDEGSLNGVYVRFRGTVEISPGDTWMAGEQVFRLDLPPRATDGVADDGTLFYSSPKRPSGFRITQLLQGGALGLTICAKTDSLQIGREGNDMNFPVDSFLSGAHCRVDETAGRFMLTDLGSRNGTYLRLRAERELAHGDYVFIGRKLLRVEMNTN